MSRIASVHGSFLVSPPPPQCFGSFERHFGQKTFVGCISGDNSISYTLVNSERFFRVTVSGQSSGVDGRSPLHRQSRKFGYLLELYMIYYYICGCLILGNFVVGGTMKGKNSRVGCHTSDFNCIQEEQIIQQGREKIKHEHSLREKVGWSTKYRLIVPHGETTLIFQAEEEARVLRQKYEGMRKLANGSFCSCCFLPSFVLGFLFTFLDLKVSSKEKLRLGGGITDSQPNLVYLMEIHPS